MILLRKKGPLTFLPSYSKFLQDLPVHPDHILKVDSDGLYPRKVVNKTTKPQLRRKLLFSSSKMSPLGSCKNMVTRSINVSFKCSSDQWFIHNEVTMQDQGKKQPED